MIIGITGKYCSGKDYAASYLQKKGFLHLSYSDFLREECSKRGIAITRENLINLGNSLRKDNGAGFLSQVALKKMEPGKNYVMTSIRNPSEVDVLRQNGNFTLIAIDAPIDLRWKRMLARPSRPDNMNSFQEFIDFEKIEHSADPNGLQLHLVFGKADVVIDNDKDLDYLHNELDKISSRKF